jgi:hypothetical protein
VYKSVKLGFSKCCFFNWVKNNANVTDVPNSDHVNDKMSSVMDAVMKYLGLSLNHGGNSK